jgi:hypothetical protein
VSIPPLFSGAAIKGLHYYLHATWNKINFSISHILPSLVQSIIKAELRHSYLPTAKTRKSPANLKVYNVYNPGRNPQTRTSDTSVKITF